MVYTEIKKRNRKKYYYRVLSIRNNGKILKKRKYLGVNLEKKNLLKAEQIADKELKILNSLISEKELKLLEKIKKTYNNQPKATLENRYESFCSQFTYNSNAIEGNTLTLQETSQLLFENIVPASKSLREINEALNHKKAFDFILQYKGEINKEFILDLHKLIVKDTLKKELENQIGKYRTLQVYLRGAEWIPPKPEEVPKEMRDLLVWHSKNKKKLHPLILASYFHTAFETIHPFVDGNGRAGRLLMNFILHKKGFPMINVPNLIKHKYYSALQKAQMNGDLKPFIDLMINILNSSKLII